MLSKMVPAPPWESRDPAIARETIFSVLRNKRRRFALHYLKQRDGAVPLDELVTQVAAWENDVAPANLEREQRQRVHVSLLQSHLPAMHGADVVRFDPDGRTVRLSAAAEDIDIYLEFVPADDIAWAEFYLGVTGFNAVLLALVWLNVYPFSLLPAAVWGLFVAGLFLLSTLIHHRYHSKTRIGAVGPPTN